jgi:AraC family transcriptional regulator of adaptative response / DNA-3-methyladenine glycosylase II
LGTWDRFETALRIIVSQQISLRGARTILGRLVEAFGTPVPGLSALGLSHVFPSAERVASASERQIAALGMPAARAATIRGFARAYASEEISLEPSTSLDDLIGQLESLPGIGAWTAHCVALRASGHIDAFPAQDLGLRKSAARLLRRDSVSAAELEERAEAWRPYRGLAAMHLWAGL